MFYCRGVKASAYDDAIKAATIAALKQSGIEDNFKKLIEDKIPKKYRDIVAQISPVISIGLNHELEFTWIF